MEFSSNHEHSDETDLALALAEIAPNLLNELEPEQKFVEQTELVSCEIEGKQVLLGSSTTSSELPDNDGSRIRLSMVTPFIESEDPDDMDQHAYISVVTAAPMHNPFGGMLTVEKLFQIDLTTLKNDFDTNIITDIYYYDESHQRIMPPKVNLANVSEAMTSGRDEEAMQHFIEALRKLDEGAPKAEELEPILQKIRSVPSNMWAGTDFVRSR